MGTPKEHETPQRWAGPKGLRLHPEGPMGPIPAPGPIRWSVELEPATPQGVLGRKGKGQWQGPAGTQSTPNPAVVPLKERTGTDQGLQALLGTPPQTRRASDPNSQTPRPTPTRVPNTQTTPNTTHMDDVLDDLPQFDALDYFCNKIIEALQETMVSVVNISDSQLSTSEQSLLEPGLSFCPTPGEPDMGQLRRDLDSFHRNLRIKTFFNTPPYHLPRTSN